MAEPVFGEGSDLAVNDGANAAFVDIDDTTSITPPAETLVEVDRNRLSATTIVERAFSTRKDPGQLVFEYECGLAKFQRIDSLKGSDKSFRITYNDDLRFAFTGRVLSNVGTQVTGGVITAAMCTVRLTSLVTVSDATP